MNNFPSENLMREGGLLYIINKAFACETCSHYKTYITLAMLFMVIVLLEYINYMVSKFYIFTMMLLLRYLFYAGIIGGSLDWQHRK